MFMMVQLTKQLLLLNKINTVFHYCGMILLLFILPLTLISYVLKRSYCNKEQLIKLETLV